MNLYLVRHGLAGSNLEGAPYEYDPAFAPYEKDDCSLTRLGIDQAACTGERLKNVRFQRVFSSPLHRALSTAAEICKKQPAPPTIELMPELVECWTPGYVRMPAELLKKIYPNVTPLPAAQEEDRPVFLPPEEAEEEIVRRADRAAKLLLESAGGDANVLAVSHGTFLYRFLLQALLGLAPEERKRLEFSAENACITKLLCRDDGSVNVICLNETGHLGALRSREPFDLR